MVLRLGPGEKRLDVKEVRAHWEHLHKANQIRIEHVLDAMKNNLAAYLAEQRSKRKLGGEIAWQDKLIRWRWSKGWLPQGFTKAFGRLWWSLQDIAPGLREKTCIDWLHACSADNERVMYPPIHISDNDIEYQKIPKKTVCPGSIDDRIADWLVTCDQVQFDKDLGRFLVDCFPGHKVLEDLPGENSTRLKAWVREDCRTCPYFPCEVGCE